MKGKTNSTYNTIKVNKSFDYIDTINNTYITQSPNTDPVTGYIIAVGAGLPTTAMTKLNDTGVLDMHTDWEVEYGFIIPEETDKKTLGIHILNVEADSAINVGYNYESTIIYSTISPILPSRDIVFIPDQNLITFGEHSYRIRHSQGDIFFMASLDGQNFIRCNDFYDGLDATIHYRSIGNGEFNSLTTSAGAGHIITYIHITDRGNKW